MALARGFKAEAERVVADLRRDLGLSERDQIEPFGLASRLGIEVKSAADLIDMQSLRELETLHPGAFSACTFRPREDRTVVVYNPLNSAARRNSDLAHELAHIVLNHAMTQLERIGSLSYFVCDARQEEEAAWLSGCLLLPRGALLADLGRGLSTAEIAKRRNVSEAMVTYRVNVTGARRQFERARAARRAVRPVKR